MPSTYEVFSVAVYCGPGTKLVDWPLKSREITPFHGWELARCGRDPEP
jgi:hypothetical protein